MVELVLSQIANGIVLGFIYVLMAIGLTIIFGLLGIVNFAHSAFFALGAYFALTLEQRFGWAVAIVVAPIMACFIGMLLEVLLFRRIYDRGPLVGIVLTFAIGLFIEAVIHQIWGASGQPFNPPSLFSGIIEIGPVLVTTYRVVLVGMTIAILLVLWAFLRFTPYGRILRAGSRDPEMVGLLGINLPLVLTVAFGLGVGITGAAGALAAPLFTLKPSMAGSVLMPAFVTVVIGGLGSYLGALIAGLIVGVTTALTIQFWPEASAASMFVIMLAVLLWRPRGLFGEVWERFE